MPNDPQDSLSNPARLDENPPAASEADLTCDPFMVFAMQDNHHRFSLGLGTILECLHAAEQEAAVPPIPEEWWAALSDRYDLRYRHRFNKEDTPG